MVEWRDSGEEESTWQREEEKAQVGSDSTGKGLATEVSVESERQDGE